MSNTPAAKAAPSPARTLPDSAETLARILEPQAWAALGIGDTLAYKNRRTSSLRKAAAILAVLSDPTDVMLTAGARSIGNTARSETNHMVRARACWKAMWDARNGVEEPKPDRSAA